jgi:hypothetical protein
MRRDEHRMELVAHPIETRRHAYRAIPRGRRGRSASEVVRVLQASRNLETSRFAVHIEQSIVFLHHARFWKAISGGVSLAGNRSTFARIPCACYWLPSSLAPCLVPLLPALTTTIASQPTLPRSLGTAPACLSRANSSRPHCAPSIAVPMPQQASPVQPQSSLVSPPNFRA